MRNHIHSLQCIVPPHMLYAIADNGTPTQQEQARQNLVAGEQMRAQRAAKSKSVPLPAEGSPEKDRVVYDAQHKNNLPGVEMRSEGDPPTDDTAVNEAYDGAGATYDLYNEVFGRNSIDNAGMKIISTVHYGEGYDNAFWNGQQMVYGDGDENLPPEERLFNRFTSAVDIIGHELAHGVTQYEAGLNYRNQSGALNESMSDVIGSLVKQRILGQTVDEADWLIGAGLFTENVNGSGIRSMKAPGTAYDDPILGKDPQPAHMDNYVETTRDNGGVHINSGIPNHAFYLTAMALGDHAWEKAGRIWYITLRDKLNSSSEFMEAAQKTYETAGELYGRNSPEQDAVRKSWAEVGLIINEGNGDDDDDNQQSGCLPALLADGFLRGLFSRG